jgi:hypothetical protein
MKIIFIFIIIPHAVSVQDLPAIFQLRLVKLLFSFYGFKHISFSFVEAQKVTSYIVFILRGTLTSRLQNKANL